MNDIDNILAQYGIPSNNEESQEDRMEEGEEIDIQEHENQEFELQIQNQETDNSLNDNLDDLLSEYGFNEPSEDAITSNASSPEELQEERDKASLLPLNSPTLLINNSTSRFSSTEWYNKMQEQKVILAGLGGIGSYVAYNIARMHLAQLVLYDDDTVDESNLSGQFYSKYDVGKIKAYATETRLKKYTTTYTIFALAQKFTSGCETGDIMICGFDSMAARKTFFTAWRKHVHKLPEEERCKCLFIDGRLSINVMQVFCITGDDEDRMWRYETDYLFSDAEADPEYNVCSLKQTTYLASMIGALMTNLFVNFTANLTEPVIPYTLPFFTEYDAQYMIFKEVN